MSRMVVKSMGMRTGLATPTLHRDAVDMLHAGNKQTLKGAEAV